MAASAVIELRGISKSFGAALALREVDLTLRAGEVHALLGENGAGKSTLVKVLAGVHSPDKGSVLLGDRPVTIASPDGARACGIAVVHQDPVLFPALSVAENVLIDDLPRRRFGVLDWRTMRRRAVELLEGRLDVRLPIGAAVSGLSAGQQQLIEIARALSMDARALILDEPTSALSAREVEHLFRIVRDLRNDGVAIAFVGHRMEEVFELADRVTVLRDGKLVATAPAAELTERQIINHMVGRELDVMFPKADIDIGETVLEVCGLTRHGSFADVSFEVRRGEILGFAGLVGAGRTEVAQAVFGAVPADAGEIVLKGQPVTPRRPSDMLRRRVAYVPEDRQRHGAILDLSIASNITLPVLPQVARLGFFDRHRNRAVADGSARRLQVRAQGVDQLVGALSGGNQQKVVIAKWLLTDPEVLILDDPTRGIDVGAKAEVHRVITELARQGLAIVLISNELPEVLAMADRVLVFNSGRVAEAFDRRPFDAETIMAAAIRPMGAGPVVGSGVAGAERVA